MFSWAFLDQRLTFNSVFFSHGKYPQTCASRFFFLSSMVFDSVLQASIFFHIVMNGEVVRSRVYCGSRQTLEKMTISNVSGFRVPFCFLSENLFLALFDLVGNIGVELVMHLYQRTHMVSINLEAFLLQVGSSCKSGGDVGLDGRDGGPELAFLDESGGGLLVKGGNGLGDDRNVAFHRRRLGRQSHRFVLHLVVASGASGDLVLGVLELVLAVITSLGQSVLGGLQGSLQVIPLVVDPSDSVVERLGGSVGGFFGSCDALGGLAGRASQVFDFALVGFDLGLVAGVDLLDSGALGGRGFQNSLELGQAFGHLLAALFLGELLLQGAHLSLDHGVELVPHPVSAVVVQTDVPLDGGDTLLLGDLALVRDMDKDATSLALHLDDNRGESTLADLFKFGQHTGAEHDLGPATTEGVGVHACVDQGLLGALLSISGQVGEDLGGDDGVTSHEVSVGNLVRQAQHTDTDTLKHAVAIELVHDKRSVDVSGLLDLVGDDATHEVRMSRVQVSHQLHQGLSVRGGDGHHGGTLLLSAVIFLSEDEGADGVAGAGHHANNGLVDGILVLKEPAGDVVADGTGVVMDLEVSLGLSLLGGLGLAERLMLAQVLAHHFLQVGLVGGLGHDALFLQHGQDAHLLLDQLDGDDQVHAEIDKGPLDTLGLVLFLLLDEHVMVEELLETLVGVVDQELFQDVELENLETGDVQNADEVLPGVGRVQGVVDQSHDPVEHTSEQGFGSGRHGEVDLIHVLTLLDEILADLQLGLHESVGEVIALDVQKLGAFNDASIAVGFGLLLASLLLPLLVAQESDGDGSLVQPVLLILGEAEGVQGGVGGAHLLGVVHAGDGQHALGDEVEISGEGLVAQQAHLPVVGIRVGHQLVEDVVIPLDLKLEGDARLFQEVGLDIGGGDLGGGAEMDTDELTEAGGVVVSDGFGVTVGLQGRVGLDNLLLEGTGVGALGSLRLGGLGIGAVQGKVLQHLLGVLSLAGTRLSGNERRLMFVLHLEELQSSVSDGVQVGRGFVSPFVAVEGSHDGSVHHQPLVGVDTDTEQAGVGVDLENLVTGSQIVEDAGLVQDGQVGHVLLLLELGRVAFQNLFFGQGGASLGGLDGGLVSSFDDLGSDIDLIGVGNPAIHLRVDRHRSFG